MHGTDNFHLAGHRVSLNLGCAKDALFSLLGVAAMVCHRICDRPTWNAWRPWWRWNTTEAQRRAKLMTCTPWGHAGNYGVTCFYKCSKRLEQLLSQKGSINPYTKLNKIYVPSWLDSPFTVHLCESDVRKNPTHEQHTVANQTWERISVSRE